MKKSDEQAVLELAQTLLQNEIGEEPLTTAGIAAVVDQVIGMNPRWRAGVDRDGAIRELETRFSVWIGKTRILENNEDHEAWLTADRKAGWRLWPRYRQYLEQNLSPVAVEALESATDDVLSRMEDPARDGVWDRRGLVVGHVQSGKTSNYTGLLCKAADAGYKVVIVLAGIHKNLRSQTQMRLDEGFLGYETMPGGDSQGLRSIGVGLIDSDHSIRPDYVTNRSDDGDFNLRVVRNLGISPGGRPLLFVVKKNKSVLTNIIKWVDGLLNGRDALDVPLLLVDDEADHASVDTKDQAYDADGRLDPEHSPAVINGLIRRLLKRFDRSVYVGYTATPFANIFISDKGETREEGEDLFPRSFIINLPAPSNYDGPVRIFGLDPSEDDPAGQPPLGLFREITDHADSLDPGETSGWVPPIHRNGHPALCDGAETVPPSLRRAILSFLLTCAARRARGQLGAHNSMLVHVTRFTSVQKKVRDEVEAELIAIRNRIRLGDRTSGGVMEELKNLWDSDYAPTTATVAARLPDRTFAPVDWSSVEAALPVVAADIVVKEINGTAKDVLDYETHKATGFSVIAIGGDKLARGLTLEGLSVSYFLRATRMYDTLMQMGRWFGYRPGYLDLCRLYSTSDLEEWFCHITEASEELRREFDHMHAVGGTPRDYGLKVRAHPVLMVTSRVKMRNSTSLDLVFSGALQETVVFHRDAAVLRKNLSLTDQFLASLGDKPRGVRRERPDGKAHEWEDARLWQKVPGDAVADYLEGYETHPSALKMNGRVLADYTRAQLAAGRLTSWDVAMLGGSQAPGVIGGYDTPLFLRSLSERIRPQQQVDEGRAVIRRLLAPRDEAIDLDCQGYADALQNTVDEWVSDPGRFPLRKSAPETPSGPAIRRVRGHTTPERGLLLIYPLDPSEWKLDGPAGPIIGIGVSFPETAGARPVRYSVNNIYWQQEFGDGS
ncbi:MAG: Z1 domain-containing protein [Alphaproteobacteria bacterium]|nr:Z1 domain-containing protein [Alphaproteobacteria bacterium]MBU1512490.1 Z1 domain-containing protein [Alphaproteobacteria bacterium]MBU2096586.1 Z1 domain-containing protein [Alphaproteobacteria bacterium]MBU2151596.1 Z1 domain-containing protein [Alphaproteobacteria bacterium]MBU2307314.1 Z1 domain-containing protein [Alphaproteobacteria bacterium]